MLTETQYNRLQTLVKASSRAWLSADYVAARTGKDSTGWPAKHRARTRQAVRTGQALMRLMRVQREPEVKPVCKECNGEGSTSCDSQNCCICPETCRKCNSAAYNLSL